MTETESVITIAALADTHFSEATTQAEIDTLKGQLKDIEPYVDIYLHGGDFTDRGNLHGAHLAATLFNDITTPKVAVAGNHDLEKGEIHPEYRIRKILEDEGGIQILNGDTFNLQHRTGKVQFIGVPGYNTYYKRGITEGGIMSTEEFDEIVERDFTNLRDGMSAVNGTGNVLLLHFPFRPVKSHTKLAYMKRRFERKNETPSTVEHIVFQNRKKFGLILFGHVHDPEASPRVEWGNVGVINISSPVTITMSQRTPYRLIELPVR